MPMELNLLGLFGSSLTRSAAAGDMHESGRYEYGNDHAHARTAVQPDKMAALMAAARRNDELQRPCNSSSFRDQQLQQGFMQVPRLPRINDQVVRGLQYDGTNGMPPAIGAGIASQQPQHHSPATTPQRTTAADHATAKVTISCAGATHVLDNVPGETIEQFMLSLAKVTGSGAAPPAQRRQPADQRAASPSTTEMLKLWAWAHDQDSDDSVVNRRKASLYRFLRQRMQRLDTIAPYPRRNISTASAQNKEKINSRFQKNRNDDEDALLTELKI